MPATLQLIKVTANGEQLVANVIQCDPVTGKQVHTFGELTQLFDRCIEHFDTRMIDMNMRMLEAQQLQPYCNAEVWVKVQQVMEVLCGRMDVNLLRARWQSEIEETAMLEEERKLAVGKQCLDEAESYLEKTEY